MEQQKSLRCADTVADSNTCYHESPFERSSPRLVAANPQDRDTVAPFLRTCDGCSSSRPVQGVPDALRHRWGTPNNNTKHTQHVHIALMQRTCVRMLSRFPVIGM